MRGGRPGTCPSQRWTGTSDTVCVLPLDHDGDHESRTHTWARGSSPLGVRAMCLSRKEVPYHPLVRRAGGEVITVRCTLERDHHRHRESRDHEHDGIWGWPNVAGSTPYRIPAVPATVHGTPVTVRRPPYVGRHRDMSRCTADFMCVLPKHEGMHSVREDGLAPYWANAALDVCGRHRPGYPTQTCLLPSAYGQAEHRHEWEQPLGRHAREMA